MQNVAKSQKVDHYSPMKYFGSAHLWLLHVQKIRLYVKFVEVLLPPQPACVTLMFIDRIFINICFCWLSRQQPAPGVFDHGDNDSSINEAFSGN